jgi:hypothetical protein
MVGTVGESYASPSMFPSRILRRRVSAVMGDPADERIQGDTSVKGEGHGELKRI